MFLIRGSFADLRCDVGFPAGAIGRFGGRAVEELFRLGSLAGWLGLRLRVCLPSCRARIAVLVVGAGMCPAFWNGALECVL